MDHRSRIALAGLISLLAVARSGAAEFVVDPARCSVEAAVHATGDDFVAKLERFESSIQVDKPTGRPSGGHFTWDFKDLKTAKAGRDKEMLHWLDYDHMPQATFTFQKCEENDGQVLLTGELKMHNVSHPLVVPLKISRQGAELTWTGAAQLDHRSYDLPRIVKFAILRVDPVLKLTFTLAGTIKD